MLIEFIELKRLRKYINFVVNESKEAHNTALRS